MSRLILLYRKPSPSEVTDILNRDRNKAAAEILFADPVFLPAELQENPAKLIKPPNELIAPNNKSCLYEVMERGQQLIGGKKLLDWLSYRGNTYWFYVKGIVTLKYRASVFFIKSVEHLLELLTLDDYEQVDVYHSDPYVTSSAGESSKVRYFSSNVIWPDKKKKRRIISGASFSYAVLFLIRALLGAAKLFKIIGKKKHLLITNPNDIQAIIAPNRIDLFKGDPYMEYLLIHAENDPEFLYLSEVYPQHLSSNDDQSYLNKYLIFYKYYKKSINFEFYMLLCLLNPLTYVRLSEFRSKLKASLKAINAAYGSGDSNDAIFAACLASVSKLLLYIYLRECATKVMLALLPVKSLGGIKEQGSRNMPIIHAAKRAGIPTYGIQHGAIIKLHEFYTFSDEDVKYTPWPDHTLVYGDYWKDVLTRFSVYPPDQVITLGQMRTDIVSSLQARRNEIHIPGLDNTKPIVCYAAQPEVLGEEHVRDQFTHDVLKMAKELSHVQFVIKPHPSDEKNPDYFNDIASQVGTDNYMISRTELYYLLAVSDVIIAYFSTVAAEAVYFKKNLVLLDYLKSEFVSYLSDVGFKVTNYDELKEVTEKVIEGTLAVDSKTQQAFIDRMAFKIDGQTTERYLNFIKSLG